MAEDILKLLSWPDSPIILVFFDPERRYQIPRGTPSAEAENTRGGKILRFSAEIAVYLGNRTK